MTPRSPLPMPSLPLLLLLVLVLPFSSPTSPRQVQRNPITSIGTSGPPADILYAIMIDAGSTGSRVHVHAYFDTHPIPRVLPSKSVKIKPGLSAYRADPVGGGRSLSKLLEFAKTHVPLVQWKATPVFLKATAGLRSIEPERAQAVLRECRALIRSFPFRFEEAWAEVIPGSQEGIYGWITANYLEGVFYESQPSDTVGVIEVGGASMQITFVPKTLEATVSDKLTRVRLGPHTYTVYTHSYLNYGLEAAQMLFNEKNKAHLASGHPCYPHEYTALDGVKGTGQRGQCAALMDNLFPKTECPATCSFDSVFQPPITDERFYCIENYYYTTQFFDGLTSDNPFELIERTGEKFCSLQWSDVVSRFQEESEDDLSKYCFSSVYLPKVLRRGFGLPEPARNAKIVREINGFQIDWALGAVVHEIVDRLRSPQQSAEAAAPGTSEAPAGLPWPFSSLMSPSGETSPRPVADVPAGIANGGSPFIGQVYVIPAYVGLGVILFLAMLAVFRSRFRARDRVKPQSGLFYEDNAAKEEI